MLERVRWRSSRIALPFLSSHHLVTPSRAPMGGEVPALGPDGEKVAKVTSPLLAARKIAVGVVGFAVLAFGVALIVLPGPAVVVIPLGLAILAREFSWAHRLLDEIKHRLRRLKARAKQIVGHVSAGGFFRGPSEGT